MDRDIVKKVIERILIKYNELGVEALVEFLTNFTLMTKEEQVTAMAAHLTILKSENDAKLVVIEDDYATRKQAELESITSENARINAVLNNKSPGL